MIQWMISLLVCAALCGAASLAATRSCRKKMQVEMDGLLQALDRTIGGELVEASFDESMNSAVAERLNRIVQLWGEQKARAEDERDTVKSLISDISHQVRTPLSNILLYAQLLKEQPLTEECLLLAGKIQRHSEKLEFFMKELVKSSYTEKAMISLHPELVDVRELVGTSCQMIEMEALKKNIRMKRKDAGASCCVDKKWTIEAIANVLENAVKYSPEDSVIAIETCLYDSFVCVKIRDQGAGIKEEEQGRVFERFYRSEDVKEQPGFGIGLYLTREVLSKEGGYVKINSRQGEGTEIALYLSRYGSLAESSFYRSSYFSNKSHLNHHL